VPFQPSSFSIVRVERRVKPRRIAVPLDLLARLSHADVAAPPSPAAEPGSAYLPADLQRTRPTACQLPPDLAMVEPTWRSADQRDEMEIWVLSCDSTAASAADASDRRDADAHEAR